eukprot:CAMPEP_0198145902 /NCGR_PEP_ID=MMETSP1443-20131203/26039_1 /TAXON_ID=186043 /ORGANISM="Entomoneis sp., Strain CCMP2396" /LENGTH=79 /DNA_ID=CAMNT_0043809663 /DNA_START=13 /DNA_END=252 /DNA_ORIENTATION=-
MKGFGFISPDDGGEQVYVKFGDVENEGNKIRDLREREPVEYILEKDESGRLRATKVTGPNGAMAEGSMAGRGQYGSDAY